MAQKSTGVSVFKLWFSNISREINTNETLTSQPRRRVTALCFFAVAGCLRALFLSLANKVTERKAQICTECLFTGQPRLSYRRLLIEFFINLILITDVPLFQKVRHCPKCGGHSMVSMESEAGQTALEKLKKRQQTVETK